ncbi:MAG: AEC family transporter [Succinivibrionaceae bacterium]|nr:AEC family transporter [Succinivibrionaceae bacterium]
MVVLEQMLIFLTLMLLGMLLRRLGLFSPESQRQMGSLVVNLTCPALVIAAAVNSEERISFSEFLGCGALFVAVQLLLILAGTLLPRLLRAPAEERGTYNLLLGISNFGFIGLPLAAALFGPDALIYLTIFILINTIAVYTHGMWVIADAAHRLRPARILIQPGLWGGIIAIALYFAPFTVHPALAQAVTMLGQITPPMAMLIIGASFYGTRLREIVQDGRLLLFCAIKMVAFPMLMLLALRPFAPSEVVLGILMVIVATPSGAFTAMVTAVYHPSTSHLASKAISTTTALSVLTIPLVAAAFGLG